MSARLIREKDGKKYNSVADIKAEILKNNPELSDDEVEERVSKESFRTVS